MFETNSNGKSGMVGAILCAALMVFTYLPKASADDSDHKTVITFGETVQIPGQALPAGTYVFKTMKNTGDGHVVQIFDKDEHKLFATLMAIPVYRDISRYQPDEPAIRFEERLSTEPQAVKIWFRPGDSIGQEFTYSKNQSQLLAKNSPWVIPETATTEVAQSNLPAPDNGIVAEPTDTTPAVQTPDASTAVTPSTDSANDEDQAAPSPMAEETPDAGLPQDQSQPSATSSDTSTTSDTKPDTLPKTGSELALIGLAGSFSLALGGVVSAYRRRARR
jgi:LPXTG-motif cell wall-anchored protein